MFGTLLLGALIVLAFVVYQYLYPKIKRQSSRFQKTVISTDVSPLKERNKVKIVTPSSPAVDEQQYRKSKMMDKSELTVDMSNRFLSMLPADLKTGFTQYNHLDLSQNQLSVIPPWFFSTEWSSRLTKLDLSFNKFFELPLMMDKLTNLQHVDISYNRLNYFPNILLKCTKLITLNLSNNELVFISPEITKLENLEELNLAYNSLSMLPDSLTQLKKLKILDIHNNKFIGSIHKILKDLQDSNSELQISQSDEKRKSVIRNSIKNRVKTKSDRIHALKEIIKSETQYNKYLNVLNSQYFLPLVMKKTENATLSFSSLEIPDETRKAMFPPGLQTIVNFNQTLLQELQKHIDLTNENNLDQSLVGDIFKTRALFFKVYTSYISGYPTAQKVVMNAINNNEPFAQIIAKGRSLPNSDGVDLPSLLIMPIQRIPRYVLLLKAVLDNTESMHPDYKSLEAAVSAMGDIATYVNTKIMEATNLRKVMDIQQELNFEDLVQPHRTFVKEGKLTMKKKDQDTSASNEIKIYLFNDLLVITEFKLLYALFGDFVRRFSLDEVEVSDIDDTHFDIVVKDRQKHYQLVATTTKEKNDWISTIAKVKAEL
jgi:hypothetical protein